MTCRKLLSFLVWVVGLGGLASVALAGKFWFTKPDLDLVIFLILMLHNSANGVDASNAIFLLTLPILMPIAYAFGPFWAGLVACLGTVDREQMKFPLPFFILNRGISSAAAVASALTLHLAMGKMPEVFTFMLSATAQVLTIGILYIAIQSLQCACTGSEDNYLSHALALTKTIIPGAAFGALFTYLYLNYSVLGVVAGYIVLCAVRSQTLFGHIDARYRLNLIKALLRTSYSKDPDLMLHLERVAYFSRRIARRCGYSWSKMHIFDEACYLHDIGKLEISDDILKSPRVLSAQEFEEIKKHPERGAKFIDDIPMDDGTRSMIRNIILHHHERYDGKGYPRGLAGDAIPLEARIVAVADAWDAMTGRRPYRRPASRMDAMDELRKNAGTQFDPYVVEVFLDVLENDPDILGNDPAVGYPEVGHSLNLEAARTS
ncbi:MAG: HD-GYP domain-containing protein [Firmicutes bacterium]|nr:HD-GYP domain-containing protein [Bacillota bacterium]